MPKLKSHSGAKKRFRATANKKLKYRKVAAQHLLTGKPPKRMRNLRRKGILKGTQLRIVKQMIPYA